MSGEVGSLAGDRVVSHERSRPANLPRRPDLRPRHAGSNPSHHCGCVSWSALLAGNHRRRNAVTVDGACKRRQSIASDKTSSFSAAACGRSGFRMWTTRVNHLIGCTIDDFATRTRERSRADVESSSSSCLQYEHSSPRCRRRPVPLLCCFVNFARRRKIELRTKLASCTDTVGAQSLQIRSIIGRRRDARYHRPSGRF